MPVYEYRCPACRNVISEFRMVNNRNQHLPNCPECAAPCQRIFSSVQIAPVMQEHFNHSVGKPISDPRQFEDELKRKGDEQSERTGVYHNYVPVDTAETKALGVTGKGIKREVD